MAWLREIEPMFGDIVVKSHNPPELTSSVESCSDLRAMKGGPRMDGLL